MDISTSQNSSPKDFQPHVSFSLESGNFLIETATTVQQIHKSLELRHEIFMEELQGKFLITGLDVDDYDYKSDHLMIVEKSSQKVVGTYRLIHSSFSESFYSQQEFFLDHFLNIKGNKLELGRACTRSGYRNGSTMQLLWRGLSQYIKQAPTQYFFGCSSIQSQDPIEMAQIFKSLEKKNIIDNRFKIHPKPKYRSDKWDEALSQAEGSQKNLRTLPPLLRSYINAGSRVHGYPAYDKSFLCFDLFTILNLRELNPRLIEHFSVKSKHIY